MDVGRQTGGADWDPGLTVWVYTRAGRGEEATAILRDLEPTGRISFRNLATLYLQTGNRERAVLMLERAVAAQEPGVADLRTDPAWQALGDPRVDAILVRLGGG